MSLDTLEKPWLRLNNETDKAWLAFETYRNMPVFGDIDERRSLVNVARILGYNDNQMVARWSSKYSWVDRCRAYDASLGASAMELKEVGIEAYHREIYRSLTSQLAVADQLIDQSLAHLMGEIKDGGRVPAVELQRMLRAIREKDDLARRAGGLPVEFTKEPAPEAEDVEHFVIGEARGKEEST